MAIFDNFPYTNVHEMNYDWIIKTVKELGVDVEKLADVVNNKIDEYVKEYIADNLTQFLLGAMYIREDTAIKLQPVEVITDNDHIYNTNRQEIIVLEGR